MKIFISILLTCIFSAAQISQVHHLLHTDDVHEVCDEDQEHLCNDENHHSCELCDLITNSDAFASDKTVLPFQAVLTDNPSTTVQSEKKSTPSTTRLRGPPEC